ncbi:HNH endonuclease signature motif containing protein [Stenotrophomonas sp. TWI1151]|uniref:HNH endonuclease n=1 Tax=Stenotrophomonas sp. TWI1151 TaxID=3136798 RepID=UPI003209D361
MKLPFQVGALYNRQAQIHALLGGQQQGGISTPRDNPVIIAFTGEAGISHGYRDFWDDNEIFHYYGEGQIGDMRYTGGNRAIDQHVSDGKKLILFQMMGKGRPYRYLGEFVSLTSYIQPNTPDTNGELRDAIVFRMRRVATNDGFGMFEEGIAIAKAEADTGMPETVKAKLVEVRTKQRLFRERLIGFEKGCRLTGIEDLRFLRASHIKPWANSQPDERVDGQNGLLLAPHADLLFDQGWISFESNGKLLVASNLPSEVEKSLSLDLKRGRKYGMFEQRQQDYLKFHRDFIFEANLRNKDASD